LAIDDGYMPAFNQLAVYYLTQAKAKAGQLDKSKRGRRGMEVSGASKSNVDSQQLDLAALVAAQAQKKNPNYAPISNTTGLIQVQLKNFNGAVKSFGKARQLDPTFFEAQMNYAAVNLSFRGFEEAEKAYRDALKLHPKDYEAQLGLALAIRGEINDTNFDTAVAEAQQHLDEAKKIAPDRPETYYNEAILTQEFRAKRGSPVPTLKKAADQYKTFIDKAGSDPAFAAAVKRSKDRSQDIADTVKFIEEGDQAAKDAANNPPPPPPPADGAAAPADGAAAPAPADAKPANSKK
jgi:tetratricopeptide (TPR) repeat protein